MFAMDERNGVGVSLDPFLEQPVHRLAGGIIRSAVVPIGWNLLQSVVNVRRERNVSTHTLIRYRGAHVRVTTCVLPACYYKYIIQPTTSHDCVNYFARASGICECRHHKTPKPDISGVEIYLLARQKDLKSPLSRLVL